MHIIWYEAQMRACFFEGFWFLFVIFASDLSESKQASS